MSVGRTGARGKEISLKGYYALSDFFRNLENSMNAVQEEMGAANGCRGDIGERADRNRKQFIWTPPWLPQQSLQVTDQHSPVPNTVMWDVLLVGIVITVLSQVNSSFHHPWLSIMTHLCVMKYYIDLWGLLLGHFCTSIMIPSTDEAFKWLNFWLTSSRCPYRKVLSIGQIGLKRVSLIAINHHRAAKTSSPLYAEEKTPPPRWTLGQHPSCILYLVSVTAPAE